MTKSLFPRLPFRLSHHSFPLQKIQPVEKMKLLGSCCLSRRRKETTKSSTMSSGSHEYPWEVFNLKEILHATNNFNDNNKLGEGGFGTVYWGRTAAGEEIAVKRLKMITTKTEMEFAVEVEVLGRVRHKNLLGLRGYYAGGSERLIIYEYVPNQSLFNHLHGHFAAEVQLDWKTRMRIAIGSAEGIAYLHHEVSPHIIHRDIKASNVLLNAKFRPKVADFGFAKLIPDGVSHLTTRVKGTLGYLAPEYAMWGKVSEGCDVYSFGILLLEIVSGRKPIVKLANGGKHDILQWAKPLIETGKWEQLADQRMGGHFNKAQLRCVVALALNCTDGNPENRPTMREVVHVLRLGLMDKKVVDAAVEDEAGEDYTVATVPSNYNTSRNEDLILR